MQSPGGGGIFGVVHNTSPERRGGDFWLCAQCINCYILECGKTKNTCCKSTTSSTDLHLQFKNDEVN